MRRFAPLLTSVVSLLLLVTAQPAAAATPTLPDLAMARLADIRVDNTADGRALLRFSTTIVNIGAGRFELSASRPNACGLHGVPADLYGRRLNRRTAHVGEAGLRGRRPLPLACA